MRNTFHLESFIWVSDKVENASQSIYNPLAPGGPQTPAPMSVRHGQRALHAKKGLKKENCFLKTEILFIWNHSFGSQIWWRMHLRASRTLWLLGGLKRPPDLQRNVSAPRSKGPALPKRVKRRKLFRVHLLTYTAYLAFLYTGVYFSAHFYLGCTHGLTS